MSAERTAEEWGRVAVSLPGWRWMPQMLDTSGLILLEPVHERTLKVKCWDMHDPASLGTYSSWLMLLDPDDPATTGCIWVLAGRPNVNVTTGGQVTVWGRVDGVRYEATDDDLGRACIAYAERVGRWPGGKR